MSSTHTASPAAKDMFDRQRRAARRARHLDAVSWFDAMIAEQLLERLDDVSRTFTRALVIGSRNRPLIAALRARIAHCDSVEPSALVAATTGAIHGEEDMLPVEPESYDLIIWPGGMEGVNDVPGALLRARLALQPDGLMIGCVFGDGSFPTLRRALGIADAPAAIARMHPQLSLPTLGDLLTRSGFALIVTDVERLSISYSGVLSLVYDLRQHAMTSSLAQPLHLFGKSGLARLNAAFLEDAAPGNDGTPRAVETARLLHFSGWAPAPDQPKPARRGSATMSLAQALARKDGG